MWPRWSRDRRALATQLIATALPAVIAANVKKSSAGRVSLLVYLNIGEFGIRQAEIEAAMARRSRPPALFSARAASMESEALHHGSSNLLILGNE